MKLLLVEPSILLRERLTAILASIGSAGMLEVSTAEDAGQLVREMQPEIVVMDAHLPDASSLEALARVRSESPSACLIVVSFHTSEPYRKRWLQAGADHCFDLPMQIDQLMNVVCTTARRSCALHHDVNANG